VLPAVCRGYCADSCALAMSSTRFISLVSDTWLNASVRLTNSTLDSAAQHSNLQPRFTSYVVSPRCGTLRSFSRLTIATQMLPEVASMSHCTRDRNMNILGLEMAATPTSTPPRPVLESCRKIYVMTENQRRRLSCALIFHNQ
jgi:hypothetical protein